MANNIANRSGTSLSTEIAANLLAGISESRSSTIISGGGKPILRMLKTGKWVYGQTDEIVQVGSEWAINPLSIMHGWVCWSNHPGAQKNEKLGEILAPITERKPVKPEPQQGFPFTEVRVLDLRCVYGDDEGTEVVYNASSVGGMRAIDGFLAQLVAQIKSDPAHLVAVVTLGNDSYQHPKYGETFVPVIEILDWADMEGNRVSDGEYEDDSDAVMPEKPAPEKPAVSRQAARATTSDETAAAATTTRASATPRRQRPAGRA